MNNIHEAQAPIFFDLDGNVGNGSYAFMFSIYKGIKTNSDSFLCNAYINSYFDSVYYDIYEQDYNFIDKGIFDILSYPIFTYQLVEKSDELFNSIFEKISQKYVLYLCLRIDSSSFSDCISGKYDCDCVIYSIDLKNRFLGVVSIYDEKFVEFILSFDDFLKSILIRKDDRIVLQFKKVNLRYVENIDIKETIKDFYDYIKSANRKSFSNDSKIYGINSLLAMKSYIKSSYINSLNKYDFILPLESIKSIDDHKLLMYNRLVALEVNKYISEDHWSERYCIIQEWSKELYEKSKSFNKDHSAELIEEITDTIQKIFDKEKEILTQLCEDGFLYEQ